MKRKSMGARTVGGVSRRPALRAVLCALGAAGGLPALAVNSTPLTDFQKTLGQFQSEATENIRNFRENYYNETQPEDRKKLEDHLVNQNRIYLRDPLLNWAKSDLAPSQAMRAYAQGSAEEINALQRQMSGSAGEAGSNFKRCMKEGFSEDNDTLMDALAKAGSTFSQGVSNYAMTLTQNSGSRKMVTASVPAELEGAAKLLDTKWGARIGNCCEEVQKQLTNPKEQKDAMDRCDRAQKRIADLNKGMDALAGKFPAPVTPPNPFDTGFSPSDLVTMLNNSRFRAKLDQARRSGETVDDQIAAEEQFYADVEQDCRAIQRRTKNRTNPFGIDNDTLRNIGQTLCTIGGSLGMGASMTVQRTTTALGRQFCNPAEMDAYDQSADQARQALLANIQAHGNPPYIALMRQPAPPLDTFTVTALPLGGYVVGDGGVIWGTVGTRDPNDPLLTGNAGALTTSRVAVGGAVASGGILSGRRVAASRVGVRGLAYGSALTRGTRALSSGILRGRSPQQSAQILRSGASSARRLVSTLVTNNRTTGLAKVRQLAKTTATRVSGAVRRLASTRSARMAAQVGRTTSAGALGTLRGRARVATTGPGTNPSTTVGTTIDNIQQNAEKERKRIESLARGMIENIRLAGAKIAQAWQKRQLLIQQRDNVTAQALSEANTTSLRRANDITREMGRQQNAIDTQIGELQAQIDAAKISKIQQQGSLQNLISLGTEGAKYPYYGGAGSPPSGFPTAPSAGRGTSTSAFLEGHPWLRQMWVGLNPLRDVWAASDVITGGGGYRSNEEWARAWLKYQQDYERYVETKFAEEKSAVQALAQLVRERAQSIRPETVAGYDTDVLITAEMHAKALSEESTDLLDRTKLRGPGSLSVDNATIQSLRATQEESRGALASLDELAQQYREFYPLSADENPEAWWPLAGDLLLY
jgi:hypothetical protein